MFYERLTDEVVRMWPGGILEEIDRSKELKLVSCTDRLVGGWIGVKFTLLLLPMLETPDEDYCLSSRMQEQMLPERQGALEALLSIYGNFPLPPNTFREFVDDMMVHVLNCEKCSRNIAITLAMVEVKNQSRIYLEAVTRRI